MTTILTQFPMTTISTALVTLFNLCLLLRYLINKPIPTYKTIRLSNGKYMYSKYTV